LFFLFYYIYSQKAIFCRKNLLEVILLFKRAKKENGIYSVFFLHTIL